MASVILQFYFRTFLTFEAQLEYLQFNSAPIKHIKTELMIEDLMIKVAAQVHRKHMEHMQLNNPLLSLVFG
ncbi:hypothetical protein AQUCO_01100384v1 [Aquilegia coerulea]|uniref:Uncharacterized protein n=1 Tax=Aquilegia coerulea TaxID=218851 RepID=A0A2G5E734_AQUCA|nr:hypothetical protein AQUCO_01100384v1 [Aquilegia coerulea]